jgi:hypothetical protein
MGASSKLMSYRNHVQQCLHCGSEFAPDGIGWGEYTIRNPLTVQQPAFLIGSTGDGLRPLSEEINSGNGTPNVQALLGRSCVSTAHRTK